MTETPGATLDRALAAQDEKLADLEGRVSALEGQDPSPPDPPQPTSGLIYGYGHTNRARLETDTGVLVCADRCYEGGPIPSSWAGTKVAKNLADRYTPILSFKPGNWANAGKTDAEAFKSFLRSVPRPIVLIPHHEPENDGKNPADYKGMIARYDALAAEVGNAKVTMAMNLMRSWVDKPAGQRSEDYIPAKGSLTLPWVLSWDGYQKKTADGAAKLFDPLVALNTKYGYPFAICETATSVGSNAGTWVKEITDYCVAKGAPWCCYWPSQTSEQGADDFYPPPAAMDAFADVALDYGGTPA